MSSTSKLFLGDCLEVMASIPGNSIDAIITDGPYGISFMGKEWDHGVPGVEFWSEMLRIAKPGAHILSFGGTRMYHRMAVAVEDAGWEIRDCLYWVYGTGFPKSHNIGNGMGTALKPAVEPIVMARKPFKQTVARNVLEWGVGALNIDDCRVGQRWPANLIHDGSDEVVELFPQSKGGAFPAQRGTAFFGTGKPTVPEKIGAMGDSGSAARFFYCAKPSNAERDCGCQDIAEKAIISFTKCNGTSQVASSISEGRNTSRANNHPTVKPIALMEYLIKLITIENQVVLDPFMGSGTTGIAARNTNREFIGIEMNPDYYAIAEARICQSS